MKKILVVDNDKLILGFVKDLLQDNGHEVLVAEDGLVALDILEKNVPDIVFVDLIMPNIDGRKLCGLIRRMNNGSERCCIAVMSALVAEETVDIIEVGADIIIAKGSFSEMSGTILSVVEHTDENRRKCLNGEILGAKNIWPRKITQELLSAKNHVELILEKMKEGILEIEADGRIVSANASVCRIARQSEDNLLGMKFMELFGTKDQARVTRLLKQDGKTEKIDEEHPGLFCGQVVTLNIIPLKDHAVAIINDITERKRKERDLKESQELIRSLVDNMLDAAVIIDRNGKTLFANNASAELVGMRSPEEGVGRRIADFVHPDYRKSAIRNYLMAHQGDAKFLNEYKIFTLDGKEKEVEGLGTNIMYKGKPAHIITLRDISERKRSEEKIREGIIRLSNNLEEAVISLASAFEMKDPYTAGHQKRVTEIVCAIAHEMNLTPKQIQGLHLASLVHDIGKINVPTEILSKPGKISTPEMALIRIHSEAGYNILKNINFPWPISRIVFQHHERMDGSGYPRGLSGETILLEARIIAVADVVEAMASHRPYRPSLGIEKALSEIEANQGILYDKAVAAACLHLFRSGKFRFDEGVRSLYSATASK